MNEFDDIEEMLKPQCEFKASDTLKQEVIDKARKEVHPHHTLRLWPWLAAACAVGFMVMFLMPPQSSTDGSVKGTQLVAEKVAPQKNVEEQQAEPLPELTNISTDSPKSSKASAPHKRPRQRVEKVPAEAPQEEPVQMSEETRMELLLARLAEDMPKMEDINTDEDICQLRMRGKQLISMYEENDK